MRALFLTHNFPRFPGDAAGSFLLRLATSLRDVGVDVRVVAPAGPGLARRESIEGVDVVRFRYARVSAETLAYTGEMAANVARGWSARFALGGMLVAGARALRREVLAWSADVVHAHWWFPAGLSASTPFALAGRPLVVTSHGSDVRLARSVPGARQLFAAVARRADRLTFVSRWLRDEAAALAPFDDALVAPMPANAKLFCAAPLGAPRRGLLFVGRLNAQKGLADLLRALPVIPSAPHLTVVGDGPDRLTLESLAESLGVAARVRWEPAQRQGALALRYATAAALVVPSRDEGLGLVAVEGQLSGTPVVAYASGGLTDVVVDGETGLLVPVGDVRALAHAAARLLADPSLARTLGARGRDAALGRFSPEASAAAYRGVYESVLAPPSHR